MRARYFGVIFDQVPSYAEIACGTTEVSKIPGVNELFKLTNPGIIDLVRHIDLSWNTLEPSLKLMHEKLSDLGWTYYNGRINIIEPATKKGDFHKTADTKDRKPSENVQVRQCHGSETSQRAGLDGDIHD